MRDMAMTRGRYYARLKHRGQSSGDWLSRVSTKFDIAMLAGELPFLSSVIIQGQSRSERLSLGQLYFLYARRHRFAWLQDIISVSEMSPESKWLYLRVVKANEACQPCQSGCLDEVGVSFMRAVAGNYVTNS